MDKIVWTPHLYHGKGLEIDLDRTFAKEMLKSKIFKEKQDRLNQIASEDLKKQGINWLKPYTFQGDSAFISKFYLGSNGVWLSAETIGLEDILKDNSSKKPIKYDTHNVDNKYQIYALMMLFDTWVEYSDVIRQ